MTGRINSWEMKCKGDALTVMFLHISIVFSLVMELKNPEVSSIAMAA